MTNNNQKLDWSGIALLEYLLSKKTFKEEDIKRSLEKSLSIFDKINILYVKVVNFFLVPCDALDS